MYDAVIQEFGPDIILGMPKDEKMKMLGSQFKNITIWEEVEPLATQHLTAEDVIEELVKVPDALIKYVRWIVLSPFANPKDYIFKDVVGETLASCDYHSAQITIFKSSKERADLKNLLAKHFTLQHEIGHIIGGGFIFANNFNSIGLNWLEAMCSDAKVERTPLDLPKFFVSKYAEDIMVCGVIYALLEDVADSVAYFTDEKLLKTLLRINYPNRYKILEEILK